MGWEVGVIGTISYRNESVNLVHRPAAPLSLTDHTAAIVQHRVRVRVGNKVPPAPTRAREQRPIIYTSSEAR